MKQRDLTGFPLIGAPCRAMKRHQLVWYGMALCCVHDYSRDPVKEPRSYTLPRTPDLKEAA